MNLIESHLNVVSSQSDNNLAQSVNTSNSFSNAQQSVNDLSVEKKVADFFLYRKSIEVCIWNIFELRIQRQ